MKGSLKTLRVSQLSSKTNFNDWSDPKYKLPPKCGKTLLSKNKSSQVLEPTLDLSDKSSESIGSQTSIQLREMRDKIRTGNPLMSKKEIRNFRLPFHESLLLNLKEDGFILTYEFIKDLISVDDIFHKDLETDFSLKKRPFLKFSKPVLISLSEGLMKAETSKLDSEKTKEANAFLDLATLFSDSKDPSWHWIAQEMFEQCMEVVNNFVNPVDLYLKASAKYFYALFLFNEMHNLIQAKEQTECSMSISESKYWTVFDTKEKKGNTLYFESCLLLHKIFLEMAQNEMFGQNTEEAIQLCRNSLLMAKVINSKVAEVDALGKLIHIYLVAQQHSPIPDLLGSYMKLCTELENFRGLCDGYILSARYHNSIGQKVRVIEDMNKLLQIAKENNITTMTAMAHHKLATYCLLRGEQKELHEHAVAAYTTYSNLNKNAGDIEETRCLIGVAEGQEIMTEYCNLVVDADSNNLSELLILLRWKSFRVPFFDKNMEFIPEMLENAELLQQVEGKRNEEYIDHARRQSQLESLSGARNHYLSTDWYHSLQQSTSFSSSATRWTSDPSQSAKDPQPFIDTSVKTNATNKHRTITFVTDRKSLPPSSATMEHQ